MGWLLVVMLLGVATWNFFVGVGIAAGVLTFLSVWLIVELLLKSYHQDGYYHF